MREVNHSENNEMRLSIMQDDEERFKWILQNKRLLVNTIRKLNCILLSMLLSVSTLITTK